MKTPSKIGIIGCGKIVDAYFTGLSRFPDLVQISACADLDLARAQAKAAEHAVPKACTPAELLADPTLDIVLNLTIPQAHAEINLAAIASGKHTYCEKPFALTSADAARTLAAAENAGVLTGCAPDTFLGGGIQTCRKLIDEGAIGAPVSAVAFMACPGHESWHPSPEFYYKLGGGPLFDMGPYYLTALINLIGPIRRVTAFSRITHPTRTITSQPLAGKLIDVEVNTHVAGTMEFHSGAIASLIMSFDVCSHNLPRLEIYGTDSSLSVPDPNTFGGPVSLFDPVERAWKDVPLAFAMEHGRGTGVADLAAAAANRRAVRASGALAAHVVEVMEALERSSAEDRSVSVQSIVARPEPLRPDGSLD